MSRTDEVFRPALSGKRIPVISLDNKWYKLMAGIEHTPHMQDRYLSIENANYILKAKDVYGEYSFCEAYLKEYLQKTEDVIRLRSMRLISSLKSIRMNCLTFLKKLIR